MESREKAIICFNAVKEKKAINPKLLDMMGHSDVTDYVVVCSGSSDRQVKAIADFVSKELKKEDCYALGVEGHGEAKWILMDFGDVIVHVFYDNIRDFYELEKLWPYAAQIDV